MICMIYRLCPGLDLCYTHAAQLLIAAGSYLHRLSTDLTDRDQSELRKTGKINVGPETSTKTFSHPEQIDQIDHDLDHLGQIR